MFKVLRRILLRYYLITKIILVSVIILTGISMLLKIHKMNTTDTNYKLEKRIMLLQLWLVGITALMILERVAIYICL